MCVLWNRVDVLVLPPGNKWAFQCSPCFVCSKHKCIAAINTIEPAEVKSDIRNFILQCLLYRTDQAQDVKKIEKFHSQLMRLMVAKESRSAAMETDWSAANKMSAPVIFHWKKISWISVKNWGRRCFYVLKWTDDKSSIFTSQTPLWKSRKISAFNWKLIFIFGYQATYSYTLGMLRRQVNILNLQYVSLNLIGHKHTSGKLL